MKEIELKIESVEHQANTLNISTEALAKIKKNHFNKTLTDLMPN